MEDYIFPFMDCKALQVQDDGICEKLFDDFWERLLLSADTTSLDLPPEQRLSCIRDSIWKRYWLASYASVVVLRRLNSRYSSIVLIGLDGWESAVHASVHDRESISLPNVSKPAYFDLGRILTAGVEDVLKKFNEALAESEANNTGNRRGQSAGHQGNQKTPSFARALLYQAMLDLQLVSNDPAARMPHEFQGGTTDVGLHTGCIRRNTSFPLVLSVFHELLKMEGEREYEEVFVKCATTYFLSYLVDVGSRVKCYDPTKFNRVMTIVREMEGYIRKMKDKSFKKTVVADIEKYRTHLDGLRPGQDATARGVMELKDKSVKEIYGELRAPTFPIVPDLSAADGNLDSRIIRAKEDARKNLNYSNLSSFSVTGKLQDTWVQIIRLNEFFWSIAMELENMQAVYNISDLREKLRLFSSHASFALKESEKTPHIMTVVLSSEELLAAWICFCWAHRVAEEKHPLLRQYGVALDAADLEHIALADVRSYAAVSCVRRFLRSRMQARQPFRDKKDTRAFAQQYGLAWNLLDAIHSQELAEAHRLIEDRWRKIEKTQRELSVLDSQLRIAQHKLQNATNRLKVSEERDFYYNRRGQKIYESVYYQYVEEEDCCRTRVNGLSEEISRLEQKPNNVVLGLPRSRELALEWLFYMFMPTELRDLAALAQLAQSKLWKCAPNEKKPTQNLVSWFRGNRKTTLDVVTESELRLGSHSGSPRINTPDIRQYSRETGVFFPDLFSVDPYWLDIDPFAPGRAATETTILFTEQLPPADHREFMQQFVSMMPSKTRENKSIAWREKKPDWLTQEQYIAFANLRAGPYAQIRCLVEALRDNLLPFQHECVQVLVKQLLFHLGDGWKVDLEDDWKGFCRITCEMNRQLSLLRDSPKDCDRLLLFGIMSSFLGQDSEDCRICALGFASTCRRWADDVGREVSSSDQMSPSLYWKEAKFYGYALLCFCFGRLEESDCQELAELIILFRSRALFASEIPESQSLDQPILQVMAIRIRRVLKTVSRNLGYLTKCLSLVLDDVPCGLLWTPVKYEGVKETACFEAESAGRLYSINLLNGTLLVDGVPPGTLPASVIEDPLYQRTFGNRNFEIIILGFRHYRAARRVDGHFRYDFLIDSNDMLHISEQDASLETSLVLLRRESIDLPPLLQECHSHWFSERHECVVLRKPSYRSRGIEFIITKDATYSVPPKYRISTLMELVDNLSTFDRLMLGATTLSESLASFEYKEYIHLFVDADRLVLRCTFPRFRLSFWLQDQRVNSAEFKGFHMNDGLVLEDTLPGLKSAVVLSHPDGREKVLIPDGTVGTQAKLNIPRNWDTKLSFHIYDVHRRFRHLIAGTTIGRLHLASLYASLVCVVADRRMGKPAAVIACELVRQSWKNEPLTQAETSKIMEVSGHSNLSCTLRLLCTWLWTSSNSVAFLHENKNQEFSSKLDFDLLALDEYRQNEYAQRLMPSEEATLLGTRQPKKAVGFLPHLVASATIAFVHETERKLRAEYVVEVRSGVPHTFPLERPTNCAGLELKVYEEMEESHRRFRRLKKREIPRLDGADVTTTMMGVRRRREDLESTLLKMFSDKEHSSDYHLSLLSGRVCTATSLDILRIVCDDSMAEQHVPFIDTEQRIDLRLKGIDWAALCVLEDKLLRILGTNFEEDSHAILQELESVREWHPSLHPRWLAFEVEQNLQIRPNQYSIVKQLLKTPNSVIQLNMGHGKTRVLVPMLVLENTASESISRINMLPSIVNEAMEHYRTVLVASVQRVKLFALPFHRDIPLNDDLAGQLTDEIEKCKEHQGCFVVTAQQRNSVLLKQYDQDVFVDGLKADFADILDESDAILHHDFQLVYALGAQEPLPAGPSRWKVVQALLTVLARSEVEEIASIVKDCTRVHREMTSCGSFPKIRLLLPIRGHERELGTALARQLVSDPPHELRWMKEVPSRQVDLLVSIMSDPTVQDPSRAINSTGLFSKYKSHILAARGFIAFGLLFHGLKARYRVTYGLNPQSQTKMAVPYAASDTPKPRSQYSHPDMCIVYTALSYFHEGLTKKQLKEALLKLQSMGVEAQKAIYGEWISSIRGDVQLEDLTTFDDPNKVDVNNAVQFGAIYKHLKDCMGVISFWTNNFVYPTDTCQFPSKRATSAWNVCDSGKVVGFSGTDDNRFLLPLSVAQIPPEEEALRATNGEMVWRILDCTKDIKLIEDGLDRPLWQDVLHECVALGVHALIDVAGLMAGSENEEVAHFLAQRFDVEKFRGVVYFDTKSSLWTVYETENHRSVTLGSSSCTASECFVYFDESRCRGSDLKLKMHAVALVTLEPKLTKDKFLQGCARMRKLRRDGQSLILAGTSEVVSADTNTKQVLERILHHTATTTKHGVVLYCQRGIQYYSFPSTIKDKIALEDLYAKHIVDYSDLGEFLDATHDTHSRTEDAQDLIEYCKDIGGGLAVDTHGLSEECEQELEHEMEQEEEEEVSIDRQDPYSQEDWAFEKAFSDPESLFKSGFFKSGVGFFVPLHDFIRQKVSCISPIKWARANIFCTPNFLRTIQATDSASDLSLYLRPVNAVLVVPHGRLVLISAYELDKLLPIWWKESKKTPKATLQHLFTLDSREGFGRDTVVTTDEAMAFAKLFRGYVQYTKAEEEALEKALRNVPQAHLVVQELLGMRGRLNHYDRSDLETIATKFHG